MEFVRQAAVRFWTPRTLLVMAAVALAVGIAGPFGTYAALAVALRLVYWLLVVAVSAMTAFIIEPLVENLADRWPRGPREVAVISAFTLAFTPFMLILNLIFDRPLPTLGGLGYLATCVALVGIVIRFLRHVVRREASDAAPTALAAPLLRRIGLGGQARIV